MVEVVGHRLGRRIVAGTTGRGRAAPALRVFQGGSAPESLNWFIFHCGLHATECPDPAAPTALPAARDPSRARHKTKEKTMSSHDTHDDPNEPVPWVQQLLDNPFLLLFIGVFVPMMVYTVWGVVDILTLPMAK
jgi:hypothetical protein